MRVVERLRNVSIKGSTQASILSCRVSKPPKVYTFSFIVGNVIPKSVKCIHSATKYQDFRRAQGFKV